MPESMGEPTLVRSSQGPPTAFQTGYYRSAFPDPVHRPAAVRVDSAQMPTIMDPHAQVQYRWPFEQQHRHVSGVEVIDEPPQAHATYVPRPPSSQTPPMPEVVPVSSASSMNSVVLGSEDNRR